MAELPLSRQRCRDAFRSTMTACASLANWHAKAPEPYVAHGHEAMAAIEEGLRALDEARTELLAELDKDREERAAREAELDRRVTALLAEAAGGA